MQQVQQEHAAALRQIAAAQAAAVQQALAQAVPSGDWICPLCSAMMSGRMRRCSLCGGERCSNLSKVVPSMRRTVRVDNVPTKMSGENLLLILSGMFGPTRRVQFGIHPGTTESLYATVEFDTPEAAAKAAETKRIEFGNAALDISLASS